MNKMWKLFDKPLNNMKSENIDWFKCSVVNSSRNLFTIWTMDNKTNTLYAEVQH